MDLPPHQNFASTATNILCCQQRLSPTDLSILHSLHAFTLPPKETQDELVDLYFKWVAPILPVINRAQFMTQFHQYHQNVEAENPPSILLLQAIFSTTARISSLSSSLSSIADKEAQAGCAKKYFRRAKALYDAGYEQDPVTIVQALVLMSWYYDGPQDGTETGLFYWSKIAVVIAQDHNMHQSAELSHLTLPETRLWKRIWWTLFTRDRAVSAAYGRPLSIFSHQTNVEMLTADDFLEQEGGDGPYPENKIHVQFFLQYVKLCKVLELVAFQPIAQNSPSAVVMRDTLEYARREVELNQWLRDLPKEMEWQQSKHEFWAAVLHYTYNTTLCQFYGMLPLDPESDSRASQTVVSNSSSLILSIVESIVIHDQLQYAPPSIVYSMAMLLITLKTQLSSTIPTLVLQSQRKVKICLELLGLISKRWPIAQMIRELSEIVFNEKEFAEALDAAIVHTKGGEKQMKSSKRKYKRASLTGKQARPEFMLPKARKIVKMVLTNSQSNEKTCFRNQISKSSANVNVPLLPESVTYLHTENEKSNEDILQMDVEISEMNQESLDWMEEMSREVQDFADFDLARPMIPFFGMSSWGREDEE